MLIKTRVMPSCTHHHNNPAGTGERRNKSGRLKDRENKEGKREIKKFKEGGIERKGKKKRREILEIKGGKRRK